jgi:hypothetical protein
MSKQQQQRRPSRSQPSRAKPKSKGGKQVAAARRSTRTPWIIATAVIVIGVAAVAAVATGRHTAAGDQLAPAALVQKVTSVPTATFDAVGAGSAHPAPVAVNTPALTQNGKPEVLYMGAEYCPYCATERWAMVVALSRFGTFTGLKTTHSSSTDVFADTQTFSFHGATYQSRWLAFTGVEMQSNQQQGDGYATLDTPTSAEQQILASYDRPPYVGTSAASSGGIPFIDFGGKFLVDGVTYDPTVLQGKSADAIAGALQDATSSVAQGAVGAANTFTAAICSLTHNQPATVCTDPMITKLQGSQ